MSFTPLNSRAIYPSVITLSKCLDHQKTKAPIKYTFALRFLFFSFFFSKFEHLDHQHAITIIMILICSITWNVLPIS